MSSTAFGSGFGADIDLKDNNVSEGLPVLRTGVYDVVSTDAEIKKTQNGQMLVVIFNDQSGHGQIKFNFNFIHSSAEAQRIGRDQLKTFLTHGGHKNPDKPFDYGKEGLLGLKLRIFVEHDGTYVKNNRTLDSYAIKRFAPTDPNIPASGPSAAPAPARSGGASSTLASSHQRPVTMSDEIPF